jgi:hypothetical protein
VSNEQRIFATTNGGRTVACAHYRFFVGGVNNSFALDEAHILGRDDFPLSQTT